MPSLDQLVPLIKAASAAFDAVRGPAITTDFLYQDRFGLELLLAVRKALGTEVVTWEPESIWLTHDFSPSNRDKLQAAKTVSTHPTIFTEPRGFAAVANALSGLSPALDELNPVPPEAMAWAAIEAGIIFGVANPSEADADFGPDVTEFVALTLASEGFVIAPETLEFADEALARHLSDEGRELRGRVKSAWEKLSNSALENEAFPESAEGVQLARLAAVHLCCQKCIAGLLAGIS